MAPVRISIEDSSRSEDAFCKIKGSHGRLLQATVQRMDASRYVEHEARRLRRTEAQRSRAPGEERMQSILSVIGAAAMTRNSGAAGCTPVRQQHAS